MSDPTPSVSEVFHPWRAVRARLDVEVRWQRREGTLGTWCERSRTITLCPDQNQAERRCSLTHELIHMERGDTGGPCQPSVHREAALRLINIRDLAEALAYYGEDSAQVAEELWVDEETLQTRLQHLHPSERGYLLRRLSTKENTA